MQPTPKGWSRLSVSIYYDNAAAAIDWLASAYGFEVRMRIEGAAGRIIHSELMYGEAVVMASQAGPSPKRPNLPAFASPKSLGGVRTAGFMMYVDDVEAHCAHARAAGATIVDEPTVHDYGPDDWADRSYSTLDCEGHLWWFAQRLRDAPGQ